MIHLGQVKSGQTIQGSNINTILMEIEAQERLIKYQKAYKITDFEIDVLKNNLQDYKTKLENLLGGGE